MCGGRACTRPWSTSQSFPPPPGGPRAVHPPPRARIHQHHPDEITFSTAHGDLHWANLTGPTLTLVDWEGWGSAPVGYDAANLCLRSLYVLGLEIAEVNEVNIAFILGDSPTAPAAVAVARVLAVLGGGAGSAVLSHQSGRDCAVARAPPSFASGPWGERRVSISCQTGKVNGNIVATR